MTIALAATWNPRGEINRFERLLPKLSEIYTGMAVVIPSTTTPDVMKEITSFKCLEEFNLQIIETIEWTQGRHLALQRTLGFNTSHVQYADMDRLLRWVETHPEELLRVSLEIEATDCLIIGRTQAAYSTHPLALVRTEAISNLVVSYFIERSVDVSAGSKGFSKRAVEFIIKHSFPIMALGKDAEWPILLYRAGFAISYTEVDGLDWETADRYRDQAADLEDQRKLAEAYDANPANWAQRVAVAFEIVQSGLAAQQRSLD